MKSSKKGLISLHGGCTCSSLSVFPKNWNTKKASLSKPWYIHYRFYDPRFRDNPKYKYGKQVSIRGMNAYSTLEGRQASVSALMADELRDLQDRGFNPITKQFMFSVEPEDQDYIISPDMNWLDAMGAAAKRKGYVQSTMADIKSVLKYVTISATALRLENLKIKEIKRVHLIKVLENCNLTNNRRNKYRANLYGLFSELESIETIEYNPVQKVPVLKVVKNNARLTLTKEERIKVHLHLRSNFYAFWRFMQIFFHSGARETELMRVQVKDVDLMQQRYSVLILKGLEYTRVWKVIKDMALPYWREVVANAKKEHYVFSVGLIPGDKPIRPDQISRRWRVHVKKKLGIAADFYSLKHTHSDEIAELIDIEAAAKINSHTTTNMVETVYAVGEKSRRDDRLKKIGNAFA